MSGIRNSPPISISSPRETTTSRSFASAVHTSSIAAALLFTTSAASAPAQHGEQRLDVDVRDRRDARGLRRARGSSSPARRRRRRRSPRASSGARPRLVCRMTPVALTTGRSRFERRRASSSVHAATISVGGTVFARRRAAGTHRRPCGRRRRRRREGARGSRSRVRREAVDLREAASRVGLSGHESHSTSRTRSSRRQSWAVAPWPFVARAGTPRRRHARGRLEVSAAFFGQR